MRDREHGGALPLVMITLTVLLAAGAMSLSLQQGDTRSTGLVRAAHESLYCAEAGLAVARARVGANLGDLALVLDGDASNDPDWYPIRADVGDGGDADVEVTIKDNDDETSPEANDTTVDRDLTIYLSSRCLRQNETVKTAIELVSFQGGGSVYRDQAGQGSGNTGNTN